MTFFLIFKDHPSGELWVTGSFTSERRFKLVPPTQLGKLQVKAGSLEALLHLLSLLFSACSSNT